MTVKKVWISSDTRTYLLHVLGGSLGIVLLAMFLIIVGSTLSFSMNWPRETFLLILCVGVTALAVLLALKLRRKAVRDTTIFLLTKEDRLYAMDTRRLSGHGHDVLSYVAGTIETQKFLNRFAQLPYIAAGADEILKVEHIKENRSHYAVSCRIRHPNRNMIRRAYFLVKGIPNEETLLRELERREAWDVALEPAENRNLFYILVSTLVFVCFSILCVFSHPAVAKLPQNIYFPCLGGAFLAVIFIVYFIVRQSRGE